MKTGNRNFALLYLATVLGCLAMVGPFSIDTLYPAFHLMQRDLGVGGVAMQLNVSVYLLGYALMAPVHGPLSDFFGRRPIILAALLVFTTSSLACAASPSMPILLIFRFVQGLSVGAGLIVGRAVIRDLMDSDAAHRLMTRVSMIFGIAPAIAPIVGGLMLGVTSWRGIFLLLAFIGIFVFCLSLTLPESHPLRLRSPISPASVLMRYKSIFKNRRFVLLSFAAAFNFGALVLYITSAPAFVFDMLKLDQEQFGYLFVPNIIGMVMGSYLSGRLAGNWQRDRIAGLGFIFCALAAIFNILYCSTTKQLSLPWAILPPALISFGVAITFPALTIKMLDMFPESRGGASSIQAFIAQLTYSFIAGVVSPLVSKNAIDLAMTSAVLSLMAFILWRLYLRIGQQLPIVDRKDVTMQIQ